MEENEFENIDEQVPEQTIADVPEESLVEQGSTSQTYDWKKAPDQTKAPPRVNLDGKVVVIKNADIRLPRESDPWVTPKNGSPNVYKGCALILTYDWDGQKEFYSGTKVFKSDTGRYTHPSIHTDGKSQASALLGAYAEYKKKNIKEVTLKEFMAFLNSQPKARIVGKDFENPEKGGQVTKNMVGEFVSEDTPTDKPQ